MALLAELMFIAVVLTSTMFFTRNSMLGFPCAMFWAITGAQAYTLSTVPWGDIYFFISFASLLGMTTFTALAAFGLREKRDALGEEEMEKGDGDFIGDDERVDDIDYWSGKTRNERREALDEGDGKRRGALHERAKKRRGGGR